MKRQLNILLLSFILLLTGKSVLSQEPTQGYIVTPDKVKIFYKIEGRGSDTLIVVHGGPGNSLESVRPDLGKLAENRRVIYYDQRGNGRSELIKDGKKVGYKYHVADLEAIRTHFKLDKMNLIGNSWGGLLVSLYAVEHPNRVERMILHNPAPPTAGHLMDMGNEISFRMSNMYTDEQRKRYEFVQNGENWVKAKDPVAMCQEFMRLVLTTYTYSRKLDGLGFKGDVCAGPPEAVRYQQVVNSYVWQSLKNFNLVPKLGVVKAPVLVIHGAADVIPLRGSQFWASGYPNARLLVIEKSGHLAHIETPEIFFPAVETFLKGSFPAEAKQVEMPG